MLKKIIASALIFMFCAMSFACADDLYSLKIHRYVFGEEGIKQIKADLTLIARDRRMLKPCAEEIFETLIEIDKQVSTVKAGGGGTGASFIYTFNNSQSTEKFYIDDYPHVLNLMKRAKEIYQDEDTDKLFNPAIYPLMELWQLDADSLYQIEMGTIEFTMEDVPTQQQIDDTLPLIDFDKIILDKDQNGWYIQKTYPGQKLDFGGQAKGYGADLAKSIAQKYNMAMAIIDIGGNTLIYTDAQKIPKKYNFTGQGAAILKPCAECVNRIDAPRVVTFNVTNDSVVTSGDYLRNYTIDNIVFAHVLDPSTGYPANLNVSVDGEGKRTFSNPQNSVTSSTVINPDSELADIYAKVVMLKGIEGGIDFLESKGLRGVIVTKNKYYAAVGQFELLERDLDIYKTEYTPYQYKGKTYAFSE